MTRPVADPAPLGSPCALGGRPVSKQFAAAAALLLLTEPGTRWRYSSPGYVLAAQIVARASGQSYPGFLAEHVLVPLGLTATTSGDVPPHSVPARGSHNGQPVESWPLSAMPGTGEICSTVGDMARFTAG